MNLEDTYKHKIIPHYNEGNFTDVVKTDFALISICSVAFNYLVLLYLFLDIFQWKHLSQRHFTSQHKIFHWIEKNTACYFS